MLQGIAPCGRFGKHPQVSYPTATTVSYRCWTSVTHRLCQAANPRHVEPLIETEILEALSCEELELALGAFGLAPGALHPPRTSLNPHRTSILGEAHPAISECWE